MENEQRYFLPSEVARLVLGYLKAECYTGTYNSFLEECPYLEEYVIFLKRGQNYPLTINALTLLQMLEEYACLKVTDAQRRQFDPSINSLWKQFDSVVKCLKVQTANKTLRVEGTLQNARMRTQRILSRREQTWGKTSNNSPCNEIDSSFKDQSLKVLSPSHITPTAVPSPRDNYRSTVCADTASEARTSSNYDVADSTSDIDPCVDSTSLHDNNIDQSTISLTKLKEPVAGSEELLPLNSDKHLNQSKTVLTDIKSLNSNNSALIKTSRQSSVKETILDSVQNNFVSLENDDIASYVQSTPSSTQRQNENIITAASSLQPVVSQSAFVSAQNSATKKICVSNNQASTSAIVTVSSSSSEQTESEAVTFTSSIQELVSMPIVQDTVLISDTVTSVSSMPNKCNDTSMFCDNLSTSLRSCQSKESYETVAVKSQVTNLTNEASKSAKDLHKSPRRKRPPRKRSVEKRADRKLQFNEQNESSNSTDCSTVTQDDSLPTIIYEQLLRSTQLQEILAENINKQLQHDGSATSSNVNKQQQHSASSSSTDVKTEDETKIQEIKHDKNSFTPSHSLEDILDPQETQMTSGQINDIIEMTSNDPVFDSLFSLFEIDKSDYIENESDKTIEVDMNDGASTDQKKFKQHQEEKVENWINSDDIRSSTDLPYDPSFEDQQVPTSLFQPLVTSYNSQPITSVVSSSNQSFASISLAHQSDMMDFTSQLEQSTVTSLAQPESISSSQPVESVVTSGNENTFTASLVSVSTYTTATSILSSSSEHISVKTTTPEIEKIQSTVTQSPHGFPVLSLKSISHPENDLKNDSDFSVCQEIPLILTPSLSSDLPLVSTKTQMTSPPLSVTSPQILMTSAGSASVTSTMCNQSSIPSTQENKSNSYRLFVKGMNATDNISTPLTGRRSPAAGNFMDNSLAFMGLPISVSQASSPPTLDKKAENDQDSNYGKGSQEQNSKESSDGTKKADSKKSKSSKRKRRSNSSWSSCLSALMKIASPEKKPIIEAAVAREEKTTDTDNANSIQTRKENTACKTADTGNANSVQARKENIACKTADNNNANSVQARKENTACKTAVTQSDAAKMTVTSLGVKSVNIVSVSPGIGSTQNNGKKLFDSSLHTNENTFTGKPNVLVTSTSSKEPVHKPVSVSCQPSSAEVIVCNNFSFTPSLEPVVSTQEKSKSEITVNLGASCLSDYQANKNDNRKKSSKKTKQKQKKSSNVQNMGLPDICDVDFLDSPEKDGYYFSPGIHEEDISDIITPEKKVEPVKKIDFPNSKTEIIFTALPIAKATPKKVHVRTLDFGEISSSHIGQVQDLQRSKKLQKSRHIKNSNSPALKPEQMTRQPSIGRGKKKITDSSNMQNKVSSMQLKTGGPPFISESSRNCSSASASKYDKTYSGCSSKSVKQDSECSSKCAKQSSDNKNTKEINVQNIDLDFIPDANGIVYSENDNCLAKFSVFKNPLHVPKLVTDTSQMYSADDSKSSHSKLSCLSSGKSSKDAVDRHSQLIQNDDSHTHVSVTSSKSGYSSPHKFAEFSVSKSNSSPGRYHVKSLQDIKGSAEKQKNKIYGQFSDISNTSQSDNEHEGTISNSNHITDLDRAVHIIPERNSEIISAKKCVAFSKENSQIVSGGTQDFGNVSGRNSRIDSVKSSWMYSSGNLSKTCNSETNVAYINTSSGLVSNINSVTISNNNSASCGYSGIHLTSNHSNDANSDSSETLKNRLIQITDPHGKHLTIPAGCETKHLTSSLGNDKNADIVSSEDEIDIEGDWINPFQTDLYKFQDSNSDHDRTLVADDNNDVQSDRTIPADQDSRQSILSQGDNSSDLGVSYQFRKNMHIGSQTNDLVGTEQSKKICDATVSSNSLSLPYRTTREKCSGSRNPIIISDDSHSLSNNTNRNNIYVNKEKSECSSNSHVVKNNLTRREDRNKINNSSPKSITYTIQNDGKKTNFDQGKTSFHSYRDHVEDSHSHTSVDSHQSDSTQSVSSHYSLQSPLSYAAMKMTPPKKRITASMKSGSGLYFISRQSKSDNKGVKSQSPKPQRTPKKGQETSERFKFARRSPRLKGITDSPDKGLKPGQSPGKRGCPTKHAVITSKDINSQSPNKLEVKGGLSVSDSSHGAKISTTIVGKGGLKRSREDNSVFSSQSPVKKKKKTKKPYDMKNLDIEKFLSKIHKS